MVDVPYVSKGLYIYIPKEIYEEAKKKGWISEYVEKNPQGLVKFVPMSEFAKLGEPSGLLAMTPTEQAKIDIAYVEKGGKAYIWGGTIRQMEKLGYTEQEAKKELEKLTGKPVADITLEKLVKEENQKFVNQLRDLEKQGYQIKLEGDKVVAYKTITETVPVQQTTTETQKITQQIIQQSLPKDVLTQEQVKFYSAVGKGITMPFETNVPYLRFPSFEIYKFVEKRDINALPHGIEEFIPFGKTVKNIIQDITIGGIKQEEIEKTIIKPSLSQQTAIMIPKSIDIGKIEFEPLREKVVEKKVGESIRQTDIYKDIIAPAAIDTAIIFASAGVGRALRFSLVERMQEQALKEADVVVFRKTVILREEAVPFRKDIFIKTNDEILYGKKTGYIEVPKQETSGKAVLRTDFYSKLIPESTTLERFKLFQTAEHSVGYDITLRKTTDNAFIEATGAVRKTTFSERLLPEKELSQGITKKSNIFIFEKIVDIPKQKYGIFIEKEKPTMPEIMQTLTKTDKTIKGPFTPTRPAQQLYPTLLEIPESETKTVLKPTFEVIATQKQIEQTSKAISTPISIAPAAISSIKTSQQKTVLKPTFEVIATQKQIEKVGQKTIEIKTEKFEQKIIPKFDIDIKTITKTITRTQTRTRTEEQMAFKPIQIQQTITRTIEPSQTLTTIPRLTTLTRTIEPKLPNFEIKKEQKNVLSLINKELAKAYKPSLYSYHFNVKFDFGKILKEIVRPLK